MSFKYSVKNEGCCIDKQKGVVMLIADPSQCNSTTVQKQTIWDSLLYIATPF